MLSLIPLVYKVGISAALVALISGGGYWLYDRTWDKGYNQHKLEAEAAYAIVLAEHNADILAKGVQHDKNQVVITGLTTALNRLRINRPQTCTGLTGLAGETGSPGRDAGVLPEQTDAAYRNFEQGLATLAQRCDQLNNDAIRANP